MSKRFNSRDVTVCGVPFLMKIIDGGVLFSSKHGAWGVNERYVFEYRSDLWYLTEIAATFSIAALCHFVKMHSLLTEHIGGDHEVDHIEFKPHKNYCDRCNYRMIQGTCVICAAQAI